MTSKSLEIDTQPMIDLEKIRADFPILQTMVHGKPLVYLDNAATSQKPRQVIEAIDDYYSFRNSNIHRGVHYLSSHATTAFERSREKVADFIGAGKAAEIIFTKGTTDGVNMIASGFARSRLREGDEVLISAMEHHSNIVPWQMACEATGARLKVIPMNEAGELLLEEFHALLTNKVKLVAITHISNSLGTINPIKEMIAAAHQLNIPVLVDGAQSIAHYRVDVKDLDCDFFVFSGHKLFGPTGIGILYGKEKWLEALPPYQGGGEMIKTVTFEKTTYNDLPFKFEAGTPHIEGGICLAAAIDYFLSIDENAREMHEANLLKLCTEGLSQVKDVVFVGNAENKASIVSFNIKGLHPYDVGVLLDQMGIAVRTGLHCTQPVMDFFGIPGTIRASLAFYNTLSEIEKLAEGVIKAVSMLS